MGFVTVTSLWKVHAVKKNCSFKLLFVFFNEVMHKRKQLLHKSYGHFPHVAVFSICKNIHSQTDSPHVGYFIKAPDHIIND